MGSVYKPVSITQRITSSPLYITVYILLVLLGNVGNAIVIGVVGESILRDPGVVRSSDMILVNMALSNLMVSLVRNTVVMVSDLVIEVQYNHLHSSSHMEVNVYSLCHSAHAINLNCVFSQIFLSRDLCHFMMGLWVWLRSANVWSTFFLSAFHFQTLRRVAPPVVKLHGSRGPPSSLILGFIFIWSLNFIYAIPAFIFSKNGGQNSTEVSLFIFAL